MCACVLAHVCMCVCMNMCVSLCAYVCAHVHACVCVCACMCICESEILDELLRKHSSFEFIDKLQASNHEKTKESSIQLHESGVFSS